MATILTTIALIALFASLALLVKKIALPSLCPICLGVSLTWLTLSTLILAGLLPTSYFILPVAILLGGTAVGIVYQGEKKFKAMRSFALKLTMLLAGFILAYLFLENMSWLALVLAIAVLTPLAYFFFLRSPQMVIPRSKTESIQELEKKMEECC